MTILSVILILLLIYTGVSTLYLFVFSLAGCFSNKRKGEPLYGEYKNRIAVLIPAYKEDSVIVDVARQALKQSYPATHYQVIVIADSLKPQTLQELKNLAITLLEVQFDNPTKAKALNIAMQQLSAFDSAVVLDADNIMETSFLEKINSLFNKGNKVIQGHRIAKNTNTSIALLDAISEEINNHIFRKGHRALGLSSALIGSAMAFDFNLFKEKITLIHTTGGFDKELELRILQEGIKMEYAPDAFVYDEKVQNKAVFKKQRTRWIAAQLKYLRKYFFGSFYYLLRGNIDFFNKVFQTLLPPRVLLLGLLFIGFTAGFLLQHFYIAGIFLSLLLLLMLTFALAIPNYLFVKLTFKEILHIPLLFFTFIGSFLGIRQAQRTFIHTPHGNENE